MYFVYSISNSFVFWRDYRVIYWRNNESPRVNVSTQIYKNSGFYDKRDRKSKHHPSLKVRAYRKSSTQKVDGDKMNGVAKL